MFDEYKSQLNNIAQRALATEAMLTHLRNTRERYNTKKLNEKTDTPPPYSDEFISYMEAANQIRLNGRSLLEDCKKVVNQHHQDARGINELTNLCELYRKNLELYITNNSDTPLEVVLNSLISFRHSVELQIWNASYIQNDRLFIEKCTENSNTLIKKRLNTLLGIMISAYSGGAIALLTFTSSQAIDIHNKLALLNLARMFVIGDIISIILMLTLLLFTMTSKIKHHRIYSKLSLNITKTQLFEEYGKYRGFSKMEDWLAGGCFIVLLFVVSWFCFWSLDTAHQLISVFSR